MEELMTQNIFEKAGDNITDSVREASRVTAAVADAIKDGVGAAERAARQGRDAVEDFVNESSRCIQRHPLTAVTATLVAGFGLGILTALASRRR
jgi:ElaB/YqjD/DUF883 family membrane-anchored ribosome-binding protein